VTALRPLLQLAFALALVVVGASSTLRLAANGIGCQPWPACYGRATTADAFNATPLARALRLSHRIAASSFALVALAAVAVGWRRWATGPRIAGAALLAVTAVLAWVGRYTPSPLPAVTLVNLLGGFALLALLGYLLAARAAGTGASMAGAGLLVLMVALAAQSGGGALISARLAGDACAAGCATAWLPGAGALIDPALPGAAAEIAPPRAGQALHLWHRLGGLVLTLTTIVAVFATLRGRSPRAAAVAMLAAAATGALGFAVATDPPALPAAAAHALVAGLLVASLAVAWAQRGWTSGEVGT
jgi:cytochrome c oxidase assembly protein subunit 15